MPRGLRNWRRRKSSLYVPAVGTFGEYPNHCPAISDVTLYAVEYEPRGPSSFASGTAVLR